MTCFAACCFPPQLQMKEEHRGVSSQEKKSMQAYFPHSQQNCQQALCPLKPMMELYDVSSRGASTKMGWGGLFLKTAIVVAIGQRFVGLPSLKSLQGVWGHQVRPVVVHWRAGTCQGGKIWSRW